MFGGLWPADKRVSPATSDAYFNLWIAVILFGDVLYMLTLSTFRASFSRRSEASYALFAAVVLGIVLGVISALVVPERMLRRPPRSGPSLLLAPALGALFMIPLRAFVQWRAPKAERLPTWYAGAGLGLGAAVARLVWTHVYEAGQ